MVVKLSSGRVVSVSTQNAGDELEGAHASGVSQLLLKDAGEFFDSPGGSLLVGGDTLAYTGIGGPDDDSITVVFLAAPTTHSYADGERVEVLPLTPTVTAQVVREGEGESEPAVVWHVLEPFLQPMGIRDPEDQEWCLLMSDREGDGWMVVNVRGKKPAIDSGAISYPTVVNKCSDPEPTNPANWYGGDSGLVLDSTYSAQGLHVQRNSAYITPTGWLAPNGDSFTVDPGTSFFGPAVRTYKLTGDLYYSFRMHTDTEPIVVGALGYAYDASETFIGNFAMPLSSPSPIPAHTAETVWGTINYDTLLTLHPGTDSVLLYFQYDMPATGEAPWLGSCLVVDTTGLPSGSSGSVPASGVYDPFAPTSWFDLVDVPTTFPPAPHTHAIDDVIGLQAALDTKVESVVQGDGVLVDDTDPLNPIVSLAPATSAIVPLTTVVGGVPELVWDTNNELVLTEVPL